MSKLERIYAIDRLLRPRRPVPMEILREKLERSRATITRDIQYMREMHNAPILYSRSPPGYHYKHDAEPFELPGFWFSPRELHALRIVQEVLDTGPDSPLKSLLEPLGKRIEILFRSLGHDPDSFSEKIRVLPLYKRRTDSDVFSSVCNALMNDRVFTASYHGRVKDKKSKRKLHPQRLLHYRDNWYLAAWCEKREALRLFSLDRLTVHSTTKEKSRQMPSESVDPEIGAGFGLFVGKPTQTAILRFFPPNTKWVKDEVWHPKQTVALDGEDILLTIPYSTPTELVKEVLRHGRGVRVEAPESLRTLVKEALTAALANYAP